MPIVPSREAIRIRHLLSDHFAGAQGFALIELLAAVVILAIGLLGMAGLQTTGLSANQSAYFRTQATNAISDIADRMRANPDGVDNGDYDNFSTRETLPLVQGCVSQTTGCTPSELAAYDLREWAKHFVDADSLGESYRPLLPGATGLITRADGTNNFTIQVVWQETDWSNDRQKALEDKMLTMQVSL